MTYGNREIGYNRLFSRCICPCRSLKVAGGRPFERRLMDITPAGQATAHTPQPMHHFLSTSGLFIICPIPYAPCAMHRALCILLSALCTSAFNPQSEIPNPQSFHHPQPVRLMELLPQRFDDDGHCIFFPFEITSVFLSTGFQ